jgi:two-component system CheB/CheR fusion protein
METDDNNYSNKTNEQLIAEIIKLQQRITELQKTESEREKSKKVIQEAYEYFENIVETIREPLIVLDSDLRIISANQSFYRIFHVSKEESEGQCLSDIGDKQWNIPKLSKLLLDILPQKSIVEEFEVAHDFPTIGYRIMLLNAREIIDHEKRKNILLVFEDITASRKAELELNKAMNEIKALNKELATKVKEKTEELLKSHEQLIHAEKLSALGQMSGGLAHELNSPLAGLIPVIERCLNKTNKGSEEEEEYMLMLKTAEHMARIVKDLGVFIRKPKGDFKVLNLNEAIEDTLSFSIVSLRQKGIKVKKDFSDKPLLVRGEKTELQQVVLNMITNAKHAVPEGGTVIIKTDISEDMDNVVIEFIDNGIGIEKENIDKIFNPFFTTKKEGEGTGLGLSVSLGIIQKHGGEISVESKPGEGTRFTIILPAIKSS